MRGESVKMQWLWPIGLPVRESGCHYSTRNRNARVLIETYSKKKQKQSNHQFLPYEDFWCVIPCCQGKDRAFLCDGAVENCWHIPSNLPATEKGKHRRIPQRHHSHKHRKARIGRPKSIQPNNAGQKEEEPVPCLR